MPAALSGSLLLISLRYCASVSVYSRLMKDNSNPSHGNVVTNSYYWPSGRGHVGHYSASKNVAPSDLSSSLAWMWTDPRGRYWNSPVSTLLDDEQNIYLHSLDGIRKFTLDGTLVWAYTPTRELGEEMPDTASLYDGAVYCTTTHGRIFAVSMKTGQELWSTKTSSTDGNNGWVSAYDGVVITGAEAREENRGRPLPGRGADQVVLALNASDGRVLWTFAPEAPVWNFMGSFVGDGTFVFQDYEGRAYRNRLRDGQPLWRSGGMVGTWTDGSALLGPNGVVYTVNTQHLDPFGADGPGNVCAFRLSDGKLLWNFTTPRPPNNMPAIGTLAGRTGLSLVQPIGQQVMQGAPTDVYALDADTGAVQWIFNGPAQKDILQAGDSNALARQQRSAAGVRKITLPNPWSAPSIDGRGTVFIGNQEGPIFSLRDENGDGRVRGGSEVSTYSTDAAFSGSSSPAIGQNLMAIASIDALYVFKG
mmetsp:Transcript_57953/g.180094  ORF Transcript_57953/g.180094 Transcript_57953/m.180094 type:complete len:476 (+) Transcript_57953:50-1477(+)